MTQSRSAADRPRKHRWTVRAGALASIAAVGLVGLALLAPAADPTDDAARTGAEPAPQTILVQQMAMNCRTATTVCPLPAALPIGSPCTCGAEAGTAVP